MCSGTVILLIAVACEDLTMVKIYYKEQVYEMQSNESVLDTLLRNETGAPFACQKGVCQSCMMQVIKGEVPKRANEYLISKYKEQDCFLACICYPSEDLTIATFVKPKRPSRPATKTKAKLPQF